MPKTIKVVTVTGTFPELPASKACQDGRGEGSNIRVAAANAIKDLLKKPALRGRHIKAARLTMAFGFKVVEDDGDSQVSRPQRPSVPLQQ